MATLFAAVVCVATWPLYQRLLHRVKDRQNIAALIMTLSLSLLVILPIALIAYNMADYVTHFYNQIKLALEHGPVTPPAWLDEVPIIGESINEYWQLLSTSQPDMDALTKHLLEPARNFLLAGGIFLGEGAMEMSLAAFVSFFLYRKEWSVRNKAI